MRRYELGYRPALDGLRAIAVLAVIAHHGWFLDGGFLGVDMFFVLSGMLITLILLREHARTGTIRLLAFYRRRLLRLVPALLAMLGSTWIWLAWTRHPLHEGIGPKVLMAAFYVTNIRAAYFGWTGLDIDPFAHTWSLSLEEQFYLLWPAALAWLRSRRAVTALSIAFAATSALAAFRWANGQPHAAYYGPIEHSGGLLLGCALGFVMHVGAPPRLVAMNHRFAPLSAVILLVAAVVLRPSWSVTYYGGLVLADLAIASVVLRVMHEPPRALSWPPLVFVGKISYGLYLYNRTIRDVVIPLVDWPWWALHQVVLTFVFGALSYFVVELPVLRWRDRANARIAVV